jgi:hypothetical protein
MVAASPYVVSVASVLRRFPVPSNVMLLVYDFDMDPILDTTPKVVKLAVS